MRKSKKYARTELEREVERRDARAIRLGAEIVRLVAHTQTLEKDVAQALKQRDHYMNTTHEALDKAERLAEEVARLKRELNDQNGALTSQLKMNVQLEAELKESREEAKQHLEHGSAAYLALVRVINRTIPAPWEKG